MVAQFYKFTRSHCIVCFKWVSYIWNFTSIKKIKYKNKQQGSLICFLQGLMSISSPHPHVWVLGVSSNRPRLHLKTISGANHTLETEMDQQIHSFVQWANIYWGTMLGTWDKTRNRQMWCLADPGLRVTDIWAGETEQCSMVYNTGMCRCDLSLRSVSGSPKETTLS